jgi:hypothetical protein
MLRVEDRPKLKLSTDTFTPWRTTPPRMIQQLLPAPTLHRTTDGHCVIHQPYPMDTSPGRIIDVTNYSGLLPRRRHLHHHQYQQQQVVRRRRDFTLPRLSTTRTAPHIWDTHTRVQLPMLLHDLHA